MNSFNANATVVRKPEVRYVNGDLAVCDLDVVINNREKKKDEWVDDPVFISVSYWGKAASYLGEEAEKGDKISLTGKIVQRNWEDKEGRKRSTYKVVADRTNFPILMGRKARSGG